MYCPKCNESFEEGSRRFCPTDGSRLVSERVQDGAGRNQSGIFANLIPKIGAISDLSDTAPAGVPRANDSEPLQPAMQSEDQDRHEQKDEIFFELDDIELDLADDSDILKLPPLPSEPPVEQTPLAPAPPARKVDPRKIPAGHVDLGDSERSAAFQVHFDETDPEDFVGRSVKGRYKITEFLGGDENGLSYVADDKIVGDRKMLVRILLADESDEILDSILTEERVSLSHFSHPNIARLIDSGQFTNGPNFLVSEYVDALSVSDILSIHGQFSPMRAARLVRQASYALNEAHQEGILHRDLRPENLIVNVLEGETEQLKVVNFGASNGEPNKHNSGYKAPEVLEGRIATTASDVFSLAVVGYLMLTGRMPFSGASAKQIVKSQSGGPDAPPTSLVPDLPSAVDAVFAKAFAFNAADRFPKARDLGDALYAAVADVKPEGVRTAPVPVPVTSTETLKPLVPVPPMVAEAEPVPLEPTPVPKPAPVTTNEPAWKARSPEPPKVENSRTKLFAIIGILVLIGLVAGVWYYVVNNPVQPDVPPTADHTSAPETQTVSPAIGDTEMPPLPRNIPQPANTNFYQNSKQNLKGDLLQNFVGFTMYYPKDWKVNGPQVGNTDDVRGKFIDISKSTIDGRLQEQMLVSYYPSKGIFAEDAEKFGQLVKESNETLKKILPNYEMVSEGEIKLNGDWRAYEIKFQAVGTAPSGEKLTVWGRRLFIPASRPGVRNGFSITMLATSNAENVQSVDDVGVRGELAPILYSFEPSQNF